MKNMRKVLAVVLCLALVLALAACSGGNSASGGGNSSAAAEGADLLQTIKSRGKLIIATEGDWSPWTYHDENDKLVGLDVEIGALLAEGLGVEPEYQETDWDSILAGVESGRFDIACNGVDYTEERNKTYIFSEPYVYNRTVLVVRGDNEDIHGYDDLKGKMTTNSPSSIYAEIAEQHGAEVTYVNTLNETLTLLEQGRADATINAEVSIKEYMDEHPDANLKIVYRGEGDPIAFPVRRAEGSQSLVDEVNRILAKAREDGRLAAISEKYFGLDLTTPN